ncbi:NADPH-dependent FMN reductase [Kribbella sp. DT2]|uniref:NADPH-dependent FMN reductase n=1 Tax=Kribbella sp. DT2 TaxID=3393427 RepID=UPI003CF5EEA3
MTRIAIVVGSTRPSRRGAAVAQWVLENARHDGVTFELVDLAELALPLLDEAVPAKFGEYQNAHTKEWAGTVAAYDGFVFVTPEYNHSAPAALKNAIDYLYAEWVDKAAGFVGYGTHGAQRAVEHLRLTLGEVNVAVVASQVALSVYTDWQIEDPREPGDFVPAAHHLEQLHETVGEVVRWARALQPLRLAA